MAAGDTDIGTGATITFGTSGFTGELTSVEHSGINRASILANHMGSTTARKIPGDIVDWGQLRVSFNFKGNQRPIIAAVEEQVDILLPEGTTWSANCFMVDFEWSAPIEDVMTSECTLEINGDLISPV